ncbi:hypothetical protein [Oceanobacillus profundus]|uniref:hypothetical protein n=1 Tax=Oceanobacillus profundus TaxID=372463 RepID=UPI0026E38395|nr:hypothetical protein [Oceanobacillus profundus]
MTQFLLDKMQHFFPVKDFPFLWKSVYDGLNGHATAVCFCIIDAQEKNVYILIIMHINEVVLVALTGQVSSNSVLYK